MTKISACAIFKNERPYLAEWLEFHLLMGIEHFYLYDNESTDRPLEVLAPYISDHVVSYRPWPQHPGQLDAYWDCCQRNRGERWIAFIDLDEFLYSPLCGGPVPLMLDRLDDLPGVVVNWAVYGHGHQLQRTDDLVIERFAWRADRYAQINRHVKSIVDPLRVAGRPPDPHHFGYTELGPVNWRGAPATGPWFEPIEHAGLRINHYISKSVEEARDKAALHRADNGEMRSIDYLLNPEFTTEFDDGLVQFTPIVKEAIHARTTPA